MDDSKIKFVENQGNFFEKSKKKSWTEILENP